MKKNKNISSKNGSQQITIFEWMNSCDSRKVNIQKPARIISINKKQNECEKELIEEVLKLSRHLQDE
jgi:transcription antitermination factor NusA-like protein